jgi:hypothetical protein
MITDTTEATLIKELLALMNLAITMRRLQRVYFRSRTREDLDEAREAERKFDRSVAAFKMPSLL